jgi:hypothetical protein
MDPGQSRIARGRTRISLFTALPPRDTTPERLAHLALRGPRPTHGDTTGPAESVRVTDVPEHGGGRAYLVERELEQDGYDALKALVADYLEQAELLADVPIAVSPVTGTRAENQRGARRLILRVHVPGAHDYEIGDEIWQVSLADAIGAEADTIAGNAGAELLEAPDQEHRDALRDRIVAEMTSTLVSVGDRYRAPDGVIYTLADDRLVAPLMQGRLAVVSPRASEPVVEEVLRFEDLSLGSAGTRRAVVRWSDGSKSPAMTWYADEILVCEGDLIGKTHDEIRSLHFRRDRDWLQS